MLLLWTSIVLGIITIWYIFSRRRRLKGALSPVLRRRYGDMLEENVPFYQRLEADKKEKFLQKVTAFLGKVYIEGVGTEVEDLDRVLIAASAVIPIFNFGDWEYRNLTNVILYPDTFNEEFQFEGKGRSVLGIVGTGFLHGQMILSKSALFSSFSKQGGEENTAIHEFVHLLDKADGCIDGIPELLLKHTCIIPWIKAMQKEVARIKKGRSDINPYAAFNEAEFFAVVSEYFFEKPDQLHEKHPDLYSILDSMFNPANTH